MRRNAVVAMDVIHASGRGCFGWGHPLYESCFEYGGQMPAELIQLDNFRPHLQGKARCLACKHEWHAVTPIGVVWLECPSCTLERGRFVAQAEIHAPHWHCNCGNDLFQIIERIIYCPNCGADQVF